MPRTQVAGREGKEEKWIRGFSTFKPTGIGEQVDTEGKGECVTISNLGRWVHGAAKIKHGTQDRFWKGRGVRDPEHGGRLSLTEEP